MAHDRRNANVPQRRAELEAEAEALALRCAGLSYAEIARRQGSKHASTAWRRVEAALRDTIPVADVDLLRQLEGERLDACTTRVFAALEVAQTTGNVGAVLRAVEVFVKLSERRSKLFGLDAPVRANFLLSGALEQEIEALVEALAGPGPREEQDG